MASYICITCGAQYPETEAPSDHCLICDDDRQYIGKHGQRWTTPAELQNSHHNRIAEVEPDLTGIGTEPAFAIGQRALLLRSRDGNLLWDATSLLDDATIEAVQALGGVAAIAVSHPHLAGSLVDWSHAFNNAPIYWQADNREWVTRPDPAFQFWDSETRELFGGLTLVHCGGHFPGSAVLHWPAGAEGRGALLAGDTIQVAQDRHWVSFMYSYPNMIPLNARAVQRIVGSVDPLPFDRIYGGWWDSVVASDARTVVSRSAERYIRAISP